MYLFFFSFFIAENEILLYYFVVLKICDFVNPKCDLIIFFFNLE